MPMRNPGILNVERDSGACGTASVAGPHDDRIQRAEHQANNQINRLRAVLLQRPPDEVNGQRNAAQYTAPEYDQPGQYSKVKAHQLVQRGDARHIGAEHQQQGRAGNAGQDHRGDGKRAGQEQIGILPQLQIEQAERAAEPGLAQGAQPHDNRDPDQRENQIMPPGLRACSAPRG